MQSPLLRLIRDQQSREVNFSFSDRNGSVNITLEPYTDTTPDNGQRHWERCAYVAIASADTLVAEMDAQALKKAQADALSFFNTFANIRNSMLEQEKTHLRGWGRYDISSGIQKHGAPTPAPPPVAAAPAKVEAPAEAEASAGAGGTPPATVPEERPLPTLQDMEMLWANRASETYCDIKTGDTGWTAARVVPAARIADARAVAIYETWLQDDYQMDNLKEFLGHILQAAPIRRGWLVTRSVDDQPPLLRELVANLHTEMARQGGAFELVTRNSAEIHERWLVFDNGFVVAPGRGLHLTRTDKALLPAHRKALATSIHYFSVPPDTLLRLQGCFGQTAPAALPHPAGTTAPPPAAAQTIDPYALKDQTRTGKITNIHDTLGAFVDIGDGYTGLLNKKSNAAWFAETPPQTGQTVRVRVTQVGKNKKNPEKFDFFLEVADEVAA